MPLCVLTFEISRRFLWLVVLTFPRTQFLLKLFFFGVLHLAVKRETARRCFCVAVRSISKHLT